MTLFVSLIVIFSLETLLVENVQGASLGNGKRDWYGEAQAELLETLKLSPNVNRAKNVILVLGDGMGVSTVTAARILLGQRSGVKEEELQLSFEKFPHVGLSKTYNSDNQVPDSAGTATAFLCGVKANFGTIGVNDRVRLMDCQSQKDNEVSSILQWSIDEGKSVGFVTTTRVTHASPAATYAHTPFRDWESDAAHKYMPIGESCEDIAKQLITRNPKINVILGGGRTNFMPSSRSDPEYPHLTGKRLDRRNLVQEWLDEKESRKVPHSYVWNLTEFKKVDPRKTDYLLGLFEPEHMQFEAERNLDKAGEPSLTEMTEKAIQVLQKNSKGFFLFVEGGRIDHGHHQVWAQKALGETIEMHHAVKKAMELTNEKDTLIVVSADHSHVFTIGGYSKRGHDLLDFVDEYTQFIQPSLDKQDYLTLMYANGPGPVHKNRSLEDTHDLNFRSTVGVPLKLETHGGEDVTIYARGPMSHLFHSVHEQHYIAHVMAYASCVGTNKNHCKQPGIELSHGTSQMIYANSLLTVLCVILLRM